MNYTRYPMLGYGKTGDVWRFYHLEGKPAVVGPIYHSKSELLADLTRYAEEEWGYFEYGI